MERSTEIGPALLLIVAAMIFGGWRARVQRECLAIGFSMASPRMIGPSYCIKRVDQTDVVITLDSARVLAGRGK